MSSNYGIGKIEMLRAHMPQKFKTPGSHAPVISGGSNQVLVIRAAERDELVKLRQEALQAMIPKPLNLPPNGGKSDSGNSSADVQ